jgi:hypothetical protein
MDDRWRILARVRDLRARLASNEAARRRHIQARAQAALEQALRLQAHYEELAAQASAAASPGGQGQFSAAEAQVLLSYAVGARLRAQDAMGRVRRAQLVCQHATIAADEASESYRRAATRREAVVSRWQERLRIALRKERERQDETLVEDRSGTRAAEDRE